MIFYIPGQGIHEALNLAVSNGRLSVRLAAQGHYVPVGPADMSQEETEKVLEYVYMNLRANGKVVKLDVEHIIGRKANEGNGSADS